MNAYEQYPDDEEYGDEEYEEEDDDEEEQVYVTSTEVSEQPIFGSLAEVFLKNRELLYPKNQKHIWEDDLLDEYKVDKSLIQSINHTINPI